MIANRFCLKDTTPQQIAEFLETAVRISVRKENHGLTVMNRLLEFCIIDYSSEYLAESVANNRERFEDITKRILPHMPERIICSDCTQTGMPLGILRKNYQWKTLGDRERLCVVTDEPEIILAFEKRFNDYGIRWSQTFPFETRASVISPEQLTDFENSRYRDILFLFAHNAFSRQYRVHKTVKLNENESILYEKGRCEVIVIAEE